MKLLLSFALILAFLAARADEALSVSFAGGDGAAMKTAILIVGAKTEGEATAAEYSYLARHFPHYHLDSQALFDRGKKVCDMLAFDDASGHAHYLYFDITRTFGK